MVKMTTKPVIADADTGYGGLLNVRHTVRGYEDAGVTAIQLEDQEFPKKWRAHAQSPRGSAGRHGAQDRGRGRQPQERRLPDHRAHGFAHRPVSTRRIRRGKAFAKAGADVVFVESPDIGRGDEARGGRDRRAASSPTWSMAGARRCFRRKAARARLCHRHHPALGFLSMGAALDKAYADLARNGETSKEIDLYSFAEFNKLLGSRTSGPSRRSSRRSEARHRRQRHE